MIKGLDKSDRREIAKQVMNLAHIAIGSMLFSQAISGQPFSFPAAIFGVGIFVVGYYLAIRLMRGGGDK